MSRLFLTAALACAMAIPAAFAADPATADKGLCQGDPIGAFYVTKVAGAEDDGVEAGEALCYRCKYGSRPMVMVFARQTGEPVAKLVKEIDSAVAANGDAQLKGFVTLFGDKADNLKSQGKKMAGKNVPVVVAKDKNGPANYKLSDAQVTVVIANDSQVVARHEFDADKVDVAAVMSEVKQMLN
ncbi:MAG: hypothetical protein ACF8AM_03590 [Rhodopirellula sp. JB055]|uniref:hypothetical protein n=1 Tax=Rhodopirellula sp. JB055 TaxID=3342846 RepID=UPI00370AF9BF